MRKIKIILSLIMLPCMFAKAGKINQLPNDCTLVERKEDSRLSLSICKEDRHIASATVNCNSRRGPYLAHIKVETEYQNQGYGSFLFKTMCTTLAQCDYKSMWWDAVSNDRNKQPLLEKFYQQFDAKVINVFPGVQEYKSMSIDLTPYRT